MWRNMVETIGGLPILGTPFVGLLAEQILAETSTGPNGPGLLPNDGLVPGKRYRLVLQGPFGSDGFVHENGSFTVTAPASTSYLLYEDNVLVSGTPTAVTVGAAGITVAASGLGMIVATAAVQVQINSPAPVGVEPISLAEARMQCRISPDDTSEDALLAIYIQAARESAEHELGRVLMSRECEQLCSGFPAGGSALLLTTALASSMVSVQYRDTSGVLQTMAPGDYTLSLSRQKAELLPVSGSWPATGSGMDAVQLRYMAGYGAASDVPAAVRQWLLLTISALYAQREALDATGRLAALPARFVDRLLDAERIYA